MSEPGDHIPLRVFIERILDERKDQLKMTADSLEKRLVMLNELRGDVLTRSEYLPAHKSLVERIERLENFVSKLVGIGVTLIAVTGVVGIIVGHYWK